MSAKEELLARADEEFNAFKTSYTGLTDQQLTQVMLGAWSVREILCHVAGWQREMVPVLERISRGEKPIPEGVSYDDYNAWNETFVRRYSGKSVREMVAEVEASHAALLAAAGKVPEERFAPGKSAYRTVEGVGPHHYREHAEEIRRWRRSTGY
jgi:hypothetical protein